MRKRVGIVFGGIVLLLMAWVILPGFMKCDTVYIQDFSVSDDGTEIMLEVGNFTSAGYIRKAEVHQQYGGKLYVDFYAAFGGIHGTIGAKNQFVLPLAEDTTMVAVYRNTNSYEVLLEKDGSGIWCRSK